MLNKPPAPQSFEAVALVHLDAAYNLAHWLLHDRHAAEDVVQEAMLRALKYFHTYKALNARAWILQIVRNVAYQHVRLARGDNSVSIDSEDESDLAALRNQPLLDPADGPEAALLKTRTHGALTAALTQLPVELRECIVLRELEEMSYKDIAQITDTPIGTVMSRLWRARQQLLKVLIPESR